MEPEPDDVVLGLEALPAVLLAAVASLLPLVARIQLAACSRMLARLVYGESALWRR